MWFTSFRVIFPPMFYCPFMLLFRNDLFHFHAMFLHANHLFPRVIFPWDAFISKCDVFPHDSFIFTHFKICFPPNALLYSYVISPAIFNYFYTCFQQMIYFQIQCPHRISSRTFKCFCNVWTVCYCVLHLNIYLVLHMCIQVQCCY